MKNTNVRTHKPFTAVPGTCSFCGKQAGEYLQLFKGEGVAICNHCVSLVGEIARSDRFSRPTGNDNFACSFCSRPQASGITLVAGPGVFICTECGTNFLGAAE